MEDYIRRIIDKNLSVPDEVKTAISQYALGNPGVAKVLAQQAKNLKTAKAVENLVGWPLSDHREERVAGIWVRFKP